MSRAKGSKNKKAPSLEGAVISSDGTVQPIEIDLSAKILERIYHPEDFPHDCPDPREDRDGFLRWLSAHT